jgi:23S rRNA U2552 (ribose-2'-O)-methylase RlmE/FtsJ
VGHFEIKAYMMIVSNSIIIQVGAAPGTWAFSMSYEKNMHGYKPNYCYRFDIEDCPTLDELVLALDSGETEEIENILKLSQRYAVNYMSYRE